MPLLDVFHCALGQQDKATFSVPRSLDNPGWKRLPQHWGGIIEIKADTKLGSGSV